MIMTGTPQHDGNTDEPWYVKDIRPKKAKVVEDTSVAPYIHDSHRPSLLSRGAASDNGGTGKGHVAGRIGTRQLGVAVTPDSAKAGKPLAGTGSVARKGKLDYRQGAALAPEAAPGPGKGNAERQAETIRRHMKAKARAIARARDADHVAVLQELLDRDVRRLAQLQADHLAKHEQGKQSAFDSLTPAPKAPMYLLPRGSVPRGFNSKGR